MKKILCLLLFFNTCLLLGQKAPKGATPITPAAATGTTRAVVIGISDYADERIPDLQFAHRDAEAFADYLRSPAGGSLPNEQIMLLTNEKATIGNLTSAFTWLITDSKPGDRAIIYFSGHGDVETITRKQEGFLLTWNSNANVYYAGALPISFLQNIVETLSANNVQIVMITDACRAGKLAGSAVGGTQMTNAALKMAFANEIKILSCQPDEFSIEGLEWGGGRGSFSYHLVDALYGLADANKDLSISLQEAQQYLQNIVPKESLTGQMPFAVGNLKAPLATVLPEILADWQKKKKQPGGLSPFAGKGMDAILLTGVDSSLQELYKAFNAALERGDLLTAANGGPSANDLYERLLREPEMAKLHGVMTRNLAAALQDEAQLVINKLLRTDPQIVDDAFSPVGKYDHLPAYLARAAELLGKEHFMWRFLKAKEYYFRSKTYRKERFPDLPADSLLRWQLASLDTALGFDSMAAYVYFEKGYLQFWGIERYPEIYLENFEKAISLSPDWVLSNYYAGRTLAYDMQDKKGELLLKKVIELDSTFLPAYRDLASTLGGLEKRKWSEIFIQKMENYLKAHPLEIPVVYYNYYGNILAYLERYEKAKEVLLTGERLSQGKFQLIYANLSCVYIGLGEYQKAETAAKELIEMMPLSSTGYAIMAELKHFFQKNTYSETTEFYRKAIQIAPKSYFLWDFYSQLYLSNAQYDSAKHVIRRWFDIDPQNSQATLRLAETFLLEEKADSANIQFQKLLTMDSGWYWYSDTYYKTIARVQLGKTEGLKEYIEEAYRRASNLYDFYFQTACAFAVCSKNKEALKWLEKALESGWKPVLVTLIYSTFRNPDLDHLRDTPEFKALVKKYLPDYYKE